MEARIRRGGGEYRWVLIRIGPSRNDSGAIGKWYGTGTDIKELRPTDSLRAAEKMIDEVPAECSAPRPASGWRPRVRSRAQAGNRHDSGTGLVQFGGWFERSPQQATA